MLITKMYLIHAVTINYLRQLPLFSNQLTANAVGELDLPVILLKFVGGSIDNILGGRLNVYKHLTPHRSSVLNSL